MKRIAIIAGFLVCLVILGILSLPFILSSDVVRGRILAHLNDLTGNAVNFRGAPSVSFSPFLGIEVSDLTVVDPHSENEQGMLLRVESVKAKLDLLPALIGNVEISEYQLIRPELNLIAREDGKASWDFKSGSLQQAISNAQQTSEETSETDDVKARLGSFDIVDGSIKYRDTSNNISREVAGIAGRVLWTNTSDSMEVDVDAIWRNEKISVAAMIEEPIKIFGGGESALSTNFVSGPLTFDYSGKANMFSNLFVEGNFEGSTPSINRLAEFLRTDLGSLRIIGSWSAKGKLNATLETTLLSDATLQINDNTATGVVRLAQTESGGQKLDGTLAFDEIELAETLTSSDSVADPIENAAPENFDIDLRISANAINTGRFALENVAAVINSNKNGWKIDIGNADAFGGSLVAQIASEVTDAGKQLALKFTTKASDAEALESIIGKQQWSIEGALDLKGDLRTQLRAKSLAELRFNGELVAASKEGSIDGIDLVEVFEGIQKGSSGVVRSAAKDGNTDYDAMDFKVFLSNSIASISKASIIADGTQIQLLGDADLTKGTLAIRAQRLDEEGPIPGRIIIGGTLNDPLVTVRSIPEPADIHPDDEPDDTIKGDQTETEEEAG